MSRICKHRRTRRDRYSLYIHSRLCIMGDGRACECRKFQALSVLLDREPARDDGSRGNRPNKRKGEKERKEDKGI